MKQHLVAALALLLAGCGGNINVWPFGESGPKENSRSPTDATEYRCDAGKRFWVRRLEGGDAWLIAPDRELRLARAGGDGRYAAGKVVLQVSGPTATLVDPPATFENCKLPEPPAEKK